MNPFCVYVVMMAQLFIEGILLNAIIYFKYFIVCSCRSFSSCCRSSRMCSESISEALLRMLWLPTLPPLLQLLHRMSLLEM